MSHHAPHRFNFSHLELVGNLDMVGELMCRMSRGEPTPYEVLRAAITVLRSTRDDLAAKSNLPARSLFTDAAYQAAIIVRDMEADGTFDRNPQNDEEGA